MEFDLLVTFGAFAAIIVAGVGALIAAPMMTTETVLMMVAPSMAAFGFVCLVLGVKHGEYRASA